MTDQHQSREAHSASEALAAIREARGVVAADMKYPLAYDLVYGLVCGGLVAGQGLPQPWSVLMLVACLIGLALMVHSWRKRFGFWVNGYSPKNARWIAIGLAACFVGLIIVTIAGKAAGLWWISLATGSLGFVLAIAGSRLWMAVWRRELKGAGA